MSEGSSQSLPSGWVWATLEELASPEKNAITDGPFGSNLKTSHYTSQGPRVIRLQNIGDGVFVDARAYITAEHFDSLKKHHVYPNDVVIAALGETLPRSCVIPEWVGPALVKADCIRFKPNAGLALSKYVNFALIADQTRKRTASIVHGVGRPRLNLKEIRSIPLPVPPLAEQHRIVAEIETQLTRLDASVAALKRAQANLKRYRAAVLKAACEGRLVPTEGGTWADTTLEYVLKEPLINGRSVRDDPFGFPVLRLTALKAGRIDISERKMGAWTANEAKPFLVRYGDFLVARGNGSLSLVGRGGLVDAEPDQVAFPDTLIRIRPDLEKIAAKYLGIVWNAPIVRDQIERTARTTAGIYKVNQQDLRQMSFPLPPLNEQHRIVEEVERRLSVVEEMEKTVAHGLKRAERLRQAILRKAFAGELVPQDPADEPASVLLERIRAERAGAAPKKSARKPRAKKNQLELVE